MAKRVHSMSRPDGLLEIFTGTDESGFQHEPDFLAISHVSPGGEIRVTTITLPPVGSSARRVLARVLLGEPMTQVTLGVPLPRLKGYCSVCGQWLERERLDLPILDPDGTTHRHDRPWKLQSVDTSGKPR
jgi:hypothetical protein